MRKYIHYGSSHYNPKRWKDVCGSENGFFNKPNGGFWGSPVDAEFGWHDWCVQEKFGTESLRKSFEFTLSPEARVLELTPENVWSLPEDSGLRERIGRLSDKVVGIDFGRLREDYDVLEYNVSKYPELYWSLYGWDCDCILVLNRDVIVEV